MREILTDRRLKNLQPAPAGKRLEIMDAIVPGMAVRVTDKGMKTFALLARFPGGNRKSAGPINRTRRAIGEYGAVSLEQARQTAREWLSFVKQGIDPKEAEERSKADEMRKRNTTFAVVAEDFIAEKLSQERKGREVERNIRNEFIPIWGRKAVEDIADLDILALVKAKKRTAPVQARNLLGIAKRMFGWAIDQRVYGLKLNPAESLRPSRVVGDKVVGDRILNDDELFALWRAAGKMGYPFGSIYQLLMLTALRLNEVADASWREINLAEKLWTIPAARMKGRMGKARAHAVPLTKDMLQIITQLPRYAGRSAHLFSLGDGSKPVWMSDKVKKRADDRMLRTLKALARRRGEDLGEVTLPRWTNHDIRRTVRSNLSRLRVTEEAREAILAHARPGIRAVYDHHDYLDEKREALELWGTQLHAIADSTPSNVVQIATVAKAARSKA